MKIKAAALSLLVVGALVASAGVASAGAPKLVLSEPGGSVLAVGTKMVVRVEFNGDNECFDTQEGTLISNGKSKDKIVLEAILASGCLFTPGPTGLLGTLNLSWTGATVLEHSTLQLNEEGPCAYRAHNLSSEFDPLEGSDPEATGVAKGVLRLAGSSYNCGLLKSYPFQLKVFFEKIYFPANIVDFHLMG
jgi:hypothetical protein